MESSTFATQITREVASLDSNGKKEAAEICQNDPYSNSRPACMRVVREADSFDVKAVKACEFVSGAGVPEECLEAIKNKTYENWEVDGCYSANRWTLIACLDESGT